MVVHGQSGVLGEHDAESAGLLGLGGFGAVHVQRDADDECAGVVLVDGVADAAEQLRGLGGFDESDGPGGARLVIADGEAGPLVTEIEAEVAHEELPIADCRLGLSASALLNRQSKIGNRQLQILFAVLFADRFVQAFEVFGLVAGADERGVLGADDDEVVDTDGGDEVIGIVADDDGVGGVEHDVVGRCAVAGPVELERGGVAGPGPDVEPTHGHGDGHELEVVVLGGAFHDGEVDADPLECRVDPSEHGGALVGIPRGGDLGETRVDLGLVLGDGGEERVGSPDEHARVPEVRAVGIVEVGFGGSPVGFLFERAGLVAVGAALDGVADVQIPVVRAGLGGFDAEGDQRVGLLGDEFAPDLEPLEEQVLGFDDLVGGDDGHDGFGVPLGDDRGGQTDGGEGVAAFGFADDLVVVDLGKRFADGFAELFTGADEAAFGGHEVVEAIGGEAEQALALVQRDELLGSAAGGERPEPRAGASGHDQCVLHIGGHPWVL